MSDNRAVSEFDKLDFSLDKTIGYGTEGVVSVARHRILGVVAVKLFKRLGAGHFDHREVHPEVAHVVQDHPNIVRFFGYVFENIDGGRIITGYAMEHMPDNSLDHVIHIAKEEYETLDIARWASQAALALTYLHSKGLIHRDVKPQNMLLCDHRRHLKLCDFGCTRVGIEQSMSMYVGTPRFMPPELLRYEERGRYSCKVDVYSMGVTIWEMATREKQTILLEKVTIEPLRDIIQGCVSENPAGRPTMEQLVEALKNFEEMCSKTVHTRSAQPVHTPFVPSVQSNVEDVEDDDRTLTQSIDTVKKAEVPNGSLVMKPKSNKDDQNVPSVNKTDSVKNLIGLFNKSLKSGSSYKGMVAVSPKSTKKNDSEAVRKRQPEPTKDAIKISSAPSNVDVYDDPTMTPSTTTVRRAEKIPKTPPQAAQHLATAPPPSIRAAAVLQERPVKPTVRYLRENQSYLAICYNPHNDMVFTKGFRQCRIWDLRGSENNSRTDGQIIDSSPLIEIKNETKLIGVESISAAAWSWNDEYILIGSHDGSITVWDFKKEQIMQRFYCHSMDILQICWINHNTFVSSSRDFTLKICRLGLNSPLMSYKFKDCFASAYDSVSGRMAIIDHKNTLLQIYSLTKDYPIREWVLNNGENTVSWSGNFVVCNGYEAGITLYDGTSATPFRRFSDDGICSPDVRFVATWKDMNKLSGINILDVQDGECLASIKFPIQADSFYHWSSMHWSMNCKKIVICGHGLLVIDIPEEVFESPRAKEGTIV